MKIGDTVVLCGLRQASQWNGHVGKIVEQDEDRWIVQLEENGKARIFHDEIVVVLMVALFRNWL